MNKAAGIVDKATMDKINEKYDKHLEKLKGTGKVKQFIKDNDIENRPKQVKFLNSILQGVVSEQLGAGIPWKGTLAQAAQETAGAIVLLSIFMMVEIVIIFMV